MKIIFLAWFGVILFHTTVYSQQLQPGFDPAEYMELLKITARTTTDSSYYNKIATPDYFNMIHQSRVMGLDNLWDLWVNDDKSQSVISIRGTTLNALSWLENFYAAMVPAKGRLELDTGFSFNYKLTDNPKAAVHIGWLIGTAYLSQDILPKIDSLYHSGTKNFLIIGHSQGGGIAYLLTAHLRQLQLQNQLPSDILLKTYCSAAPKPGNLYFAHEYEHLTRGGWAFNVVNTSDWVPQVPMSIQTLDDFNSVNPFVNAKAAIKKQKFPKRWILKRIYNQLDKPTRKAQRNYQKYLGSMASKIVSKNLPGYQTPQYYKSNQYVRTGTTIVLPSFEEYQELYADDTEKIFMHHLLEPYMVLLDHWYLNPKQAR